MYVHTYVRTYVHVDTSHEVLKVVGLVYICTYVDGGVLSCLVFTCADMHSTHTCSGRYVRTYTNYRASQVCCMQHC